MDDRVPEHRDSHASSSHGLSLEPTLARSADLGKYSLPERPKLRDLPEDKKHKGPCRRRNGRVVIRAEIFGDLITADHKVLSEGCESRNKHPICSRGAGLGHPMDPGVSVQKQKFTRNPEKLAKVPGTREETQKSFTLTILWNSAKLVKISPGIIARQHHTDRKQMGLLREQCAE